MALIVGDLFELRLALPQPLLALIPAGERLRKIVDARCNEDLKDFPGYARRDKVDQRLDKERVMRLTFEGTYRPRMTTPYRFLVFVRRKMHRSTPETAIAGSLTRPDD